MGLYRFELGEVVRLRDRAGLPRSVPESFRITALMPRQGGSCHYKMRSEIEDFERVAKESDLEAASPAGEQVRNNNRPGL